MPVEAASTLWRDHPLPGKNGAVAIEVAVDPEGRAYRCEPLQIIGEQPFGRAACKSHRRWRFVPPTDAEGAPTFAVIRTIAFFTTGPQRPPELQGLKSGLDITLTLEGDRSLAGLQIPAYISISPEGEVTRCETKAAPDALATAACDAARQTTWTVLLDAKDKPVPYVRQLVVALEAAPSG